MTDLSEFPPILAEIAEVIGADAALALASEKGGQRVYIPSKVDETHWLSLLIGFDLANQLCEHYRVGNASDRKMTLQGTLITVPMARLAHNPVTWKNILAQGLTASETAKRMGCHVRTVYRQRDRFGYSHGSSASSTR